MKKVTYELKITHDEIVGGWFTRTFASEREFQIYMEVDLPEAQKSHKLCELAYRKQGQDDSMNGYHNYR